MTTYFDVTDIVQYAKGNSRVSGIQRVQLRIIAELTRRDLGHDVGAVYFDEHTQQHLAFDFQTVFGENGGEFEPRRVLQSLGITKPRRLPEKYQIRRYLKPYDHSKVLRGLVKAKLYLLAYLRPRKLLDMGFHEWRSEDQTIQRVKAEPVQLRPQDNLALLGAFWEFDRVIDLARRHKERGGRVAVLVHDVIPKVAPQYCSEGQVKQFWPRFQGIAQYANRFLAVSEHTARDFVACMAQPSLNSVRVTPLAHEFSTLPRVLTPSPRNANHRHYVLCVGTIEVRKNGVLLLDAWQRLIRQLGDQVPDLVFCGKYGWKIGPFKAMLKADRSLQARVRVVNSPSDADMAELIKGSLFTVFPSHYEGWGLPVGEAGWLGKFCVASSSSSIPEVMGPLADYVPPDDADAWAQCIIQYIQSTDRLTAKEAAICHADLRTWAQTAASMLHAIEAPEDLHARSMHAAF